MANNKDQMLYQITISYELDQKLIDKRTKKNHYMLLHSNSSKKVVEANSFDKNAILTLQFYLTNLCFYGVGIYGVEQSMVNKKKAKNIDIVGIAIKEKIEDIGISRANIKGNPSKDRADVEKNQVQAEQTQKKTQKQAQQINQVQIKQMQKKI